MNHFFKFSCLLKPKKKTPIPALSPEKAFLYYQKCKTKRIIRYIWLGLAWLGLAWLGLQEMYHLLISPIYLNNPKFCDFVTVRFTAEVAKKKKML